MRHILMALAACLWAVPLRAEGEKAGDFDYYVMALSWSAAWCEMEGDARDDPQCDTGRGLTFILHGLWPQHDQGWPSFCRTSERDPARAETAAMADIMGGAGLAFYQWKKHGRCSGLSAADYYATARRAYDKIKIPALFSGVSRPLTLPARVIEDAFVAENPGLGRNQITVTCRNGLIQEVRICLTPGLDPRTCGPDVIQDCTLTDAVLEAVR